MHNSPSRPGTEGGSRRIHSRRLKVAKSLGNKVSKEIKSKQTPSNYFELAVFAAPIETKVSNQPPEPSKSNTCQQRNTSPSQILFDSKGQCIKRSYIGPIGYIQPQQVLSERAPYELLRQLRKQGKLMS